MGRKALARVEVAFPRHSKPERVFVRMPPNEDKTETERYLSKRPLSGSTISLAND